MWRFIKLFVFLLKHPQVGKYKKLILVGFPILYLIMPDPIPVIIDDLIIIALGFWAFVKTAQKDVKVSKGIKGDDVIDVDARVINDE